MFVKVGQHIINTDAIETIDVSNIGDPRAVGDTSIVIWFSLFATDSMTLRDDEAEAFIEAIKHTSGLYDTAAKPDVSQFSNAERMAVRQSPPEKK